jgi:molybdate transport system regulatory protein
MKTAKETSRDLQPRMRLHLWLEVEGGMVLGLGRAMLLAKVHELGSLNKAAKAMGMSYRAAWGRLKKTEDLLGLPLVVSSGGRSGFTLTPLGESLVKSFQRWHEDVERYALETSHGLFPFEVRPFGGPEPFEPGEPSELDGDEKE